MERPIKPFHSAGIYYSGDRFDAELPEMEENKNIEEGDNDNEA